MSEWRKTGIKMGGFLCIKHKITSELCLSGKWGEIWLNSNDPRNMYSCFSSGRISTSRLSKSLGLKANIKDHSEAKFTFPEAFLPKAIKILQIPKSRPSQIRYAEQRSA